YQVGYANSFPALETAKATDATFPTGLKSTVLSDCKEARANGITSHIIFYTSTGFSADMTPSTTQDEFDHATDILEGYATPVTPPTGIDRADIACSTLNLGRPARAILSTSAVDARDRFTLCGPISNTNNSIVFANGGEIWDTDKLRDSILDEDRNSKS